MPMRAVRVLATATIAAAIYAAPAAAQEQRMEGIIVTHEQNQLTVKTPSGNQPVTLAPGVRVRSLSGAFKKEVMPESSLIPGLPVVIDYMPGPSGVVAHEVDYKAKDYKTAAQIQAGVEETARREAELRSAYSKMGQWDVRMEKNVFFKTGSATISSEGKHTLNELAKEASGIKGYVISVLGYADPRGTKKANQQLSNRRAQAVINHLKQSGHVLPGKVLAASAMGETFLKAAQAADEQAHANSRRVTVRVVTSAAHLKP